MKHSELYSTHFSDKSMAKQMNTLILLTEITKFICETKSVNVYCYLVVIFWGLFVVDIYPHLLGNLLFACQQ